jgi:tRNA (guanine37-N1)-methyltransferase|tara:strand:+ start:579 stop:1355 length:777 start_codon:yes stop_codon:yes gene_type:complete
MKTFNNLFIFDVITLMPEMISALTSYGVTGRAFKDKRIDINLWNPRDFTKDAHKTVDDRPYGGGPGMLMMVEPLVSTIIAAKKRQKDLGIKKSIVIHMTPKGKVLDNNLAKYLSKQKGLILVASRYEGVDERINNWVDEEISVGDYVTSGGELPAMIVMDSLIRHIPGVLNDIESANQDSFVNGLLDYPHYTRPYEYEGLKTPDILLSGDHEKIRIWRLKESLRLTRAKRPDLFVDKVLNKEESRLLEELIKEQEQDS